ncbi:uncharacterized protein V6R79_001391 [Siganus canaliculatus]
MARERERERAKDDFRGLMRNFTKFIRADYHLHRVNSPNPQRMPQFFKRYQKDLESAEHYERVKEEVKESIRQLEVGEWERAEEVASRWARREDGDDMNISSAGSSKRKARQQGPSYSKEEQEEGSRSRGGKGERGKGVRRKGWSVVRQTPTPDRGSRKGDIQMECETGGPLSPTTSAPPE